MFLANDQESLYHNVAGVVIIYHPPTSILSGVMSYLDQIQKLYIIDNSTACNQELINQLILVDKVEYISNYGNKGIAYALNQSCLRAIHDGFTWILTMDQDSSFDPSNFSRFLTHLKSKENLIEKVGIFSPYHVINDNVDNNNVDYEKVKVAMTSGNILNLRAFSIVGNFKEKLFIDYVDHEYCLRLRKFGYEVIQCNKVHLRHHLGNSQRYTILRMTATHHNYIRRYYITRNRLYVIWRYKSFDTFYCVKEFFLLMTDMVKIGLVERDKLKKIRSVIYGVKDFLIGRYGEYHY